VAMNKVAAVADELERTLRGRATAERAAQEKRYLKSAIEHLGCTMPVLAATAKAFKKARPDLTHDELVALVEELWPRGIFEDRAMAVELLELHPRLLVAEDVELIERVLRDAHTWALVDALAVSVVGPLVERFPALTRTMARWARDEDFWIRRSALLSQLLPLRKGRTDLELFGRWADPMLEEREFFIRKAIGWVLREASKQDPQAVYEWLLPRAARASGLTIREATKYLAPKQRDAVLAAATHVRGRAQKTAR
jgi:3-methyladenine DNA glycosylase AlkD